MLSGENPTNSCMACDDNPSFSRSVSAPSRPNSRWRKQLTQLAGSFLLGAIFSAILCVHVFYQEFEVAEQKVVAQLTAQSTLPGLLPTTLPNPVANSITPAPTSAPTKSSALAPSTITVSLRPKHVTEKDGQCALFTKEELSQILETNLTEVTSDSTGCNYKGSGRGNWVRYEITWKGGREALGQRRSAYETLKRRLAPTDMPLQFVPNLGEEAYMTLTGILHVRKGDVPVLFNLMWFQGLPVEITKLLVDTAFARLE